MHLSFPIEDHLIPSFPNVNPYPSLSSLACYLPEPPGKSTVFKNFFTPSSVTFRGSLINSRQSSKLQNMPFSVFKLPKHPSHFTPLSLQAYKSNVPAKLSKTLFSEDDQHFLISAPVFIPIFLLENSFFYASYKPGCSPTFSMTQ